MAGLLSALAFVPSACSRRSPLNDPVADSELHKCNDSIGVQLFAVRDLMVADPRGTLAMLSEIGFREVELFGFGDNVFIDDPIFGLSATGFRDALDGVGLTAPIAHVSSDFEDISAVAGIASSLGVETLINPMATEFLTVRDGQPIVSGVTGHDQIQSLAMRLNTQGKECVDNGIGFGYHNHHMEFELLGGRPAFDVIAENTDPEFVKFELDLGWVAVSGQDPVEYINRYHDRIIAVHMKDFDPSLPLGADAKEYPIPEQAQLVEPGAGRMDFAGIVKTLNQHDICHRFVEIDVAADPKRSIERGYQYLAGLKRTGTR